MNLTPYDLILINTSGGKDSSVAAWTVFEQAEAQGVKERLLLVHSTIEEEWPGTVNVVRRQAEQLGLPLEVVGRGEGILDYARRRGKWPSPKQRWCTSDFKRAPIDKVITRRAPGLERPARILNVMGLRAQESPGRAKREPFRRDGQRTNGRRIVDEWLPIHGMKVEEVWRTIREHAIPQHGAYAAGLPRLSCVLCIFAPREALVVSGRHNPELLRKYAAIEREIGHQFRGKPGDPRGVALADVLREVEAGGPPVEVPDWKM